MKFVDRPDREVEVAGLGAVKQMTIRADARAFRNLVDSIYSEKEKTVGRELIANALDSHAAAGCADRPIKVTLPSVFEPTFIVRDYGVGMSRDFIMNHYSNLFESTKQNDNNQTGMFGVGSKSPLAITDSFTVRCFDPAEEDADGNVYPARTRCYIVSVPEDGVPEISETFETVHEDFLGDKDHRGVEIKVPVQRGSRDKLLEGLAKQQFFWFDKPIEFDGAFDEVKSQTYASIGKLADGLYYSQVKRDDSDYYRVKTWQVFARQGAAVYPINETLISSYISSEIKEAIRALCGNGHHILLDFPIGTAEVTLARENIQYGSQTCVNIGAVFKQVFGDFVKIIADAVGDTKTVPEALRGITKQITGKEYDKATWAERKLGAALVPLLLPHVVANWTKWYDGLTFQEKEALPAWAKVPPTSSTTLSVDNFPEGKVLLHEGKLKESSPGSVSFSIESPKSQFTIKHPHIIYIIPSHLQKWQDRLREHASENFKDLGYEKIPVNIVRCAKRNFDGVVASLKAANVYSEHYEVKALQADDDTVVATRNYSKTSVYQFTGHTFSEDKIEPDYTQPAYYVPRIGISTEVSFEHMNDRSVNRLRRVSNSTLAQMVEKARALGIIDATTPIYRVTPNQAEKLESDTLCPWEYLPDVLFDGAIAAAKAAGGGVAVRKSNIYSVLGWQTDRVIEKCFCTDRGAGFTETREVLASLVAADPIFRAVYGVKLAKIHKKDNELLSGDQELMSLLQLLRLEEGAYSDSKNSKVDKINDLVNEFTKRYSFIEEFYGNGYGDKLEANNLKHLKLYAQALVSSIATEKHTLDQDVFTLLEPFGSYIDDKIVELNPQKDLLDDAA